MKKVIKASRKTSNNSKKSKNKNRIQIFIPLVILAIIVLPATLLVSMQKQNLFSQASSLYTAGVTSVGKTMDSGNSNGISSTQVVSGSIGGTLSSISVYIGKVQSSPSNHMQVAIYADNGSNTPGTFLASSPSQVLTANSWNTFAMTSVPVSANTKYWLAFNEDGSKTQYAIANSSSAHSIWVIPTTFNVWPNPMSKPSEVENQQYSIYMTYASNPTPTPTLQPTAVPSPTPTVGPNTPTPTPVASGSRNPLQQPFSSTSIWNMPIGTGAVYVPANLPANPGTDNWTPMPQIDDEHIVLTPTAPLTTINYSSAGWSGKSRCNSTASSGGNLPVSVPIPANYVVPSDNTNSSAAFLMPDGRTIVQTQPLARCTAGGSATSVINFPTVDLYGGGITGSHGGSGLSAIGGSIRVGELRPGQQGPQHALKIEVDSPVVLYNCKTITDCYRWPATTADSGAVGDYGSQNPNPNPALKMGALLAIPVSVDITKMGLESVPGKELAWTLQNYGAYIVDSTGGPSYSFAAENGPNGSVRTQFQADYGYALEERINDNTPWSRDVQRIITALAVVDNNSPTSIGGGGTPLQPLAPPINP